MDPGIVRRFPAVERRGGVIKPFKIKQILPQQKKSMLKQKK